MNHKNEDIKLKCNLCRYSNYTDELWLRKIKGRFYLVCQRHLPENDRGRYDNRNKERKGVQK